MSEACPNACRALLADVQAAIMRGEDATMNRCDELPQMPRTRTCRSQPPLPLFLPLCPCALPHVHLAAHASAASGASRALAAPAGSLFRGAFRPAPQLPVGGWAAYVARTRQPTAHACLPALPCLQLPMDGVATQRRRASHVRRRANPPADCDDRGAREHGARRRGASQRACQPVALPACLVAACPAALARRLHRPPLPDVLPPRARAPPCSAL